MLNIRPRPSTELFCLVVFDLSCNVLFRFLFFVLFVFLLSLPLIANKVVWKGKTWRIKLCVCVCYLVRLTFDVFNSGPGIICPSPTVTVGT